MAILTRETITTRVREVISDECDIDIDDIKNDADLFNDLQFDSLDAVTLALALEEAFDIAISDEQISLVKTVDQIVDFVYGELDGAASARG